MVPHTGQGSRSASPSHPSKRVSSSTRICPQPGHWRVTSSCRLGAAAPIFSDVLPGVRATDPVVQALTLTDIVVGATVTALLLTFALRIFKKCGTLDPQALRSMRG